MKEGKYPATAQLILDSVDSGHGKLFEDADVVQLLVVDRETNLTRFLGCDGHGARV